MAQYTNARVVLTRGEMGALARSMENATREWAEQQLALAQDVATFNLRYEKARDRALKRCGVDLRSAYGPIDESHWRHDMRLFARSKKKQNRGTALRFTQPSPSNLISPFAPTSGREDFPFDFGTTDHGEQGNAMSNPIANPGARSARLISIPSLQVQHDTGSGQQNSAWSNSATGFWTIPQPGVAGKDLRVHASLVSAEEGVQMSSYGYSNGFAGCSLFLGIQSFDPSKSKFSGVFMNLQRADIVNEPIWSTFNINYFRRQGSGIYQLDTSINLNSNFFYVTMLWLGSYVFTQNLVHISMQVSVTPDSFSWMIQ